MSRQVVFFVISHCHLVLCRVYVLDWYLVATVTGNFAELCLQGTKNLLDQCFLKLA